MWISTTAVSPSIIISCLSNNSNESYGGRNTRRLFLCAPQRNGAETAGVTSADCLYLRGRTYAGKRQVNTRRLFLCAPQDMRGKRQAQHPPLVFICAAGCACAETAAALAARLSARGRACA